MTVGWAPWRPGAYSAAGPRARAGLAIGLKNNLDQVPQLGAAFDWAVNEQRAEYDEPFVRAGKAVFHAEYDVTTGRPLPDLSPAPAVLDTQADRPPRLAQHLPAPSPPPSPD